MSEYSRVNLDDVKDQAPDFGLGEMGQARFARADLGAEGIGLSHYRMNPGERPGFGHSHGSMEEMYVVLSGSGRFKLGDDIIEIGPRDVVYCPPETMREWEAGTDGLEMLAFGTHAEGDGESTMEQGWWTD